MNGVEHAEALHPLGMCNGKAHGDEPAHGMANHIDRHDVKVIEQPPHLGHIVLECGLLRQRQAAAVARHVHRDDTVRG